MFKTLFLAAFFLAPLARAAEPCPGVNDRSLEDKAADAIEGHRLDCLKDAVAQGANLHQLIGYGRDALDKAAWVGDLEITKYLLSIGMSLGDLNDVDNVVNHHEAVGIGGNVEVLKLYQSLGLPLTVKNGDWQESYRTPRNHFGPTCSPILHIASTWTQTQMTAYLTQQGLDLDARCTESVMWSNNTRLVTPLLGLAENYLPVKYGDNRDLPATANATLKILLDAGADLKARDDYSGKTAASLLLAATWINPEMKAYVKAHSK